MAQDLIPVNIEDEMRQSYLDYAMSVIVGRALPDARDGLKPVHRRILYAMHEQGMNHDKPYKKSARVVGDVIGKYHPHGDSAVYDAIVRMVQDFAMRAPLIDGQGNFGSVDGDNAAAMRYTEVRLHKISQAMLADIDKETVDWQPNYDESLNEPEVLPSRLPNLLLNGASGIAVGMATNIPPHNLGELCDGLLAMLANPEITVDELMSEHIHGPDFPTGGFIHGVEPIREAYHFGRGVIQIRAKTHFETDKSDRGVIIVNELPYQVNKARLLEKIAELVKDKKLEGIADLRDESDRDGMRMVIVCKRGEQPEIVLNRLFKTTAMQTSFGINSVALHDGQPQILGLKELLHAFLEHREEVVLRRSRYELRKARERAHILEGLVIALDNLDAVIKLIRGSADPATAKAGLTENFELTEVQAQAILDMRLQRLTGLERDKILAEYEEIKAKIAELEAILKSREKVLAIIADEIREVRESYATPRRTEIVPDEGEVRILDLIADDEMVVMLTHRGYIKRIGLDEFREQRRGGAGKAGLATRDEDVVEELFVARAHDLLLVFTDAGRLFWLPVYKVPVTGRTARGTPAINLIGLEEGERISTILAARDFDTGEDVVFTTERGVVKRTPLKDYAPESEQGRKRSGGIRAVNLDDGDRVVRVLRVTEDTHMLLVTRDGQSIRFAASDVRTMGRVSRGVRGVRLATDNVVVAALALDDEIRVLTVGELGYGKRTDPAEWRVQSRGGKGIIGMKVTEKTGRLVGALAVAEDDQLILITDTGRVVRIRVDSVSEISRATQGVRLMRLKDGEQIAGLARIRAADADEDADDADEAAPTADDGDAEGVDADDGADA